MPMPPDTPPPDPHERTTDLGDPSAGSTTPPKGGAVLLTRLKCHDGRVLDGLLRLNARELQALEAVRLETTYREQLLGARPDMPEMLRAVAGISDATHRGARVAQILAHRIALALQEALVRRDPHE